MKTLKALIHFIALSAAIIACSGPASIESTIEPTASLPPATASPTQTRTPSPIPPTETATITPTRTPPKTLYEERFDDEVTCFKLHSLDKGIELGIVDNAYSIRIDGNNSFSTQCIGGYDNFVMEYDVQLRDGDVHSIVGLRFRTYLGSSYNIYITGSNALCWDYYDAEADTYRNLAGCWGKLPSKLNIRDSFQIRLIVAQDNMAIVIDNQIISVVADSTNSYGTFGFFIANNGPETTEVIIDNILIRELMIEDTDVFRIEQTGF